MSQKYSMVVFDMAGTTVDEDNLVYKLMHETILSDGYECSLSMVLAVGAGKEKKDAFREVLLELGVFAPDNIAKRLNEKFQQNLFDAYLKANVKSMPGAEAVFKQLRQNEILVVLNTGYHATIAKLLLDKLNWKVGEEIDLLVTASDVNKGRPSPDMILLAMEKLHIINPNSVVKVGDSVVDIMEGKNAGCGINIGVTTGAQNEEMLLMAAPDFVIHGLDEILPIVL